MYDFLFIIIELFWLALTVEALEGKTCQDSLLSGGVGQLEPRFQGEGVVPGEYFLVSTKLDTLRYLTQYRRVTDGRTDRQTELPQLVQRLQCKHCGAL